MDAYRQVMGQPVTEVVPFQHPRQRVLARKLDYVPEGHRFGPTAVVVYYGFIGVEDLEALLPVGRGVGFDIFG